MSTTLLAFGLFGLLGVVGTAVILRILLRDFKDDFRDIGPVLALTLGAGLFAASVLLVGIALGG